MENHCDAKRGAPLSLIETEDDLKRGMAHLAALDPAWSRLIALTGCPPLRRRTGGFEGLAGIIVAQQLSVASANAIWTRTCATLHPLCPETVASADEEQMRQAGLSRPKQRTLKAIAEAILDGRLVLDGLAEAGADAVHAHLTQVKGIGPWTADIYLLFCLGHADAFAPGDLALQEAAKLAFGLKSRPSPERLTRLAKKWSPWRGVAARLLWAYYAVAKSREGVTG